VGQVTVFISFRKNKDRKCMRDGFSTFNNFENGLLHRYRRKIRQYDGIGIIGEINLEQ
jgi:hypothetical protein